MCFIVFSYEQHPVYRFVFAANRDEFYERPTAPAAFWKDAPDVLAGRDLKGGGTWMGITRGGRFAALTNFREPEAHDPAAPTRGVLVANYLRKDESARAYMERVAASAQRYNGFNLLIGDRHELLYFSNREGTVRTLEPGLYGLSNHLLDTAWPKVRRGKEKLQEVLDHGEVDAERLQQLLHDTEPAPAAELPDTGVGEEWERVLSPLFIVSPSYGTRAATALLIDHQEHVTFVERVFQAGDHSASTRHFEFEIEARTAEVPEP